jgi:hypothetical protein
MSVNISNLCNCTQYDSTVYTVASEIPCKYNRRTAEWAEIAGAWRIVKEEFWMNTTLQFSWEFTYDGNGNVVEKIIY